MSNYNNSASPLCNPLSPLVRSTQENNKIFCEPKSSFSKAEQVHESLRRPLTSVDNELEKLEKTIEESRCIFNELYARCEVILRPNISESPEDNLARCVSNGSPMVGRIINSSYRLVDLNARMRDMLERIEL